MSVPSKSGRLPAPFRRLAEGALGPLAAARPLPRRAGAARVWRLRARDGAEAVLKAPPPGRAFAQERHALSAWAPSVPGAPRLVACREAEPRALLLELRPGRPVADLAGDGHEIHHRAAGAALARLHALPHRDDDPLPLARAWPRRAEGWARRAAGRLPAGEVEALLRSAGADLAGAVRVPCHRDVDPDNWLWDEAAGLSPIDFEHARADLWLVDVAKLWTGPWARRPGLEPAFWRGYGREPTERERAWLRAAASLHALATLVRAAEGGDERLAAVGRAARARVLEPDR